MAKRKTITASEQTALLKAGIKRQLKYSPERLSPQTRIELVNLQNELYRKRTTTPQQRADYERLLAQAEREKRQSLKNEWAYKKEQSEIKLDIKIAERIKGRGESKALQEYDNKSQQGIKKQLESIHDTEYTAQYKTYTTEEKQDILRRMLGIGSRGITLADGSTFTVEEFNEILERHNIPLERFTDKEDITKERYKQVKYTEWKASIDSELRELANLSDLTDREREGVRKMLKIYGT